jgi:hypothetical protein
MASAASHSPAEGSGVRRRHAGQGGGKKRWPGGAVIVDGRNAGEARKLEVTLAALDAKAAP